MLSPFYGAVQILSGFCCTASNIFFVLGYSSLLFSFKNQWRFFSTVTEFLFLSYILLHYPHECSKINQPSAAKAILEITGIK